MGIPARPAGSGGPAFRGSERREGLPAKPGGGRAVGGAGCRAPTASRRCRGSGRRWAPSPGRAELPAAAPRLSGCRGWGGLPGVRAHRCRAGALQPCAASPVAGGRPALPAGRPVRRPSGPELSGPELRCPQRGPPHPQGQPAPCRGLGLARPGLPSGQCSFLRWRQQLTPALISPQAFLWGRHLGVPHGLRGGLRPLLPQKTSPRVVLEHSPAGPGGGRGPSPRLPTRTLGSCAPWP